MHSKLVRIPITALMLACLAPLALATEQIVWGNTCAALHDP
ncbi:hypothetical protein [Herbaspirillum sp. B65]|nr:hypothetical protein [Herbaspirillum sp. B65]